VLGVNPVRVEARTPPGPLPSRRRATRGSTGFQAHEGLSRGFSHNSRGSTTVRFSPASAANEISGSIAEALSKPVVQRVLLFQRKDP
jgi:hypothetical protein